ncbi:hypothetical protein BKI52_07975 [marine bacterium AO1-C]|nr:hypothetical protein BKI52_07975 [marine bacterium AO1-C]
MTETIYSNELITQTGNPYFTIEAKEGENFIRATWTGFINVERAKKGILEEIAAIQKTGITNLLVDNRKQTGPFPKEIDQWVTEEITPKLEALGGAKFAQILSSNVFTEVSAKNMANNEDVNDQQAISMANFANEEDALKWLIG